MPQFCYFTSISAPFPQRRPASFPFPNTEFDPAKAGERYGNELMHLALAEECGFDWVGVGEDHMSAYSMVPNPSLIASIVSQHTSKVKIAILGFPLPLLNPLRVAEECSMLDHLSGGRLIAGFVRGSPQNYAAYNVEPNESRGRFEEAVQLIVKSWTEKGVFEWLGHYNRFPGISLWPSPLQLPHPPLVFSANSPESALTGAKHRQIIGNIHLYSRNALETVKKCIAVYRERAQNDGWEPSSDRFLIGLPTCIADSDAEAQERLESALQYNFNVLSGTYNAKKREIAQTKPGYGFSPVEENPPTVRERLESGIVLCGSPRTVVAQIRRLQEEAGVGIISMHIQIGNTDFESGRTSMKLFRDHVRPAFSAQ